ncbi:MMPL family transporter [Mobilicoccus pelagius]|uniref:MMPL family transporter n=1 Tax=Mobilicoccus pelagius TaxID=746032 RepID=UPI00278C82FB|nr:MMPL family transporter [Mobilicoccus pelagius]
MVSPVGRARGDDPPPPRVRVRPLRPAHRPPTDGAVPRRGAVSRRVRDAPRPLPGGPGRPGHRRRPHRRRHHERRRRPRRRVRRLGVLPLITLTQIGVTVGIGILLDTFVVRTIVIPALFTVVGPKVWRPGLPAGDAPSEV